MEKIDIVLWVMSGGFALMLVMWHFLNQKIDRLDDKVTDIDRRVCRMEGAMQNKDGCAIKASNDLRKAE